LRFEVDEKRKGNTSVEYQVKVFGEKEADAGTSLFETSITFVNVQKDGTKAPIQ
jgi:acyl-CoA hydrolase